ncbi:hypothetical protein SLG_05560 [Sphingobium sp. SYK-6]|uniref:hypothetical protein n=1 Tax=Sphingobium sp. (strain NBRC 103272 / SYK-6) TaxID=627192 RepID=UPI000227676C|nr:hypothetical protein [Sphingobium sp. SYK-6]BAK65231.1 hypothetical protein SLG_05560 [Sphingobium sp. SYK-6]
MDFIQQSKVWLVAFTGLTRDALHIHVALVLYFGAVLLLRWRIGSWKPWLLVLGCALLGEVMDIWESLRRSLPIPWQESWKDIWNTMVWPSAILLLARYTGIFRQRR